MTRACENCGYWAPTQLKPSRPSTWYGQCRAMPPQGATGCDNGFVVTTNDAWCGAFDASAKVRGDCTACQFYERVGNGNKPAGWGECRVNPPMIDRRVSTTDPFTFPNVAQGQSCALFQGRPEEVVF
jgi:hypothetical protein